MLSWQFVSFFANSTKYSGFSINYPIFFGFIYIQDEIKNFLQKESRQTGVKNVLQYMSPKLLYSNTFYITSNTIIIYKTNLKNLLSCLNT